MANIVNDKQAHSDAARAALKAKRKAAKDAKIAQKANAAQKTEAAKKPVIPARTSHNADQIRQSLKAAGMPGEMDKVNFACAEFAHYNPAKALNVLCSLWLHVERFEEQNLEELHLKEIKANILPLVLNELFASKFKNRARMLEMLKLPALTKDVESSFDALAGKLQRSGMDGTAATVVTTWVYEKLWFFRIWEESHGKTQYAINGLTSGQEKAIKAALCKTLEMGQYEEAILKLDCAKEMGALLQAMDDNYDAMEAARTAAKPQQKNSEPDETTIAAAMRAAQEKGSA